MYSYNPTFKKIINVFIELFFFFTIISTVYVFTYPFDGYLKIVAFASLFVEYVLFAYLFKSKIRKLLKSLLNKISKLSIKQMLLIITLTMLILKIIFTIFFYFDPANGDGDITIYANIADHIVSGNNDSAEISHLLGIGYHLALFKLLNIPYHIGIFVVFLLGTIINFFSFEKIVGKDKTFLLIMIYILMPSTTLLTFCPTHELFVYLYFSLFIFLFNMICTHKKQSTAFLLCIPLLLITVLADFVSPMAKILYIIIVLACLLSNLEVFKKIAIIVVLVLSIFTSSTITKALNPNTIVTDLNTYYILVRGSSVETRGEHVDKYTSKKVYEYLDKHGWEFSSENELIVIKEILIDQYIYLLTHPIECIKLLAHKYYVIWSGDHYSVEIAHYYKAFNDYVYYTFLAISAIIYLFVLTCAEAYYKKKEDDITISNNKLLLLGIVGVLLVSLVLNKYSVYATIFIYLISFYRSDFE